MSSLQFTSKKNDRKKLKSERGAEEGRRYQNLTLVFLAERGYKLSRNVNSNFCNFSIGGEVGLGKENKFDDVVLSYVDQNKIKQLIFLQIKHKLDDDQIDSQVLSTEAATARNAGGSRGGLCRDFNLQKYFISYLSARDELQKATAKELIGGKIKYVAVYTNIGMDVEELKENNFSLKEAPGDIVSLFTLKKSSETQHSNNCYQLENVSEGVRKVLEKSSDLDRLARELAQYVVWENYKEKKIMGIDETPMKHYHVALGSKVVRKSDPIKDKSSGKQVKNELYCEAQFREDFLENGESSSKQRLRNAIFEAVKELDKSKKDAKEDELKTVLREAKWKVVPKFGEKRQNIKPELPYEWTTVNEEDITDFLKCLVFIVKQPRVAELETLFTRSIQGTVVQNPFTKQFLDQVYDTGPEFLKNAFGIEHTNTNTKQKWISVDEIEMFFESKKKCVSITFVVNAMTLTNAYKNEVLQYGRFNDLGRITDVVDSFLRNNCKILCVNTPVTLLSSIKILQHLSTESDYNAEKERIFVNLDVLNSAENRNCVLKDFELKTNSLLTIECRDALKDRQDVEFFFLKLFNIAKNNSHKKIILITQPANCVIFTEDITTSFQDENLRVIVNDSIDLKDFKPQTNPLMKKVLVFQGQKEKSLSDLIGVDSWLSYVNSLSVETSGQNIIDGVILAEILIDQTIEVGSEPPGTSSLEGAYAKIYEEINVGILTNKLTSQEHADNSNDMYVIGGICGVEKKEKTEKLIQYLGLSEKKEQIQNQLGDVGSDKKIQIADDQFQDKDFRSLCHNFPEKRIFWICVEWKNYVSKFILQEVYNPRFYLKRKFEDVIIKKDLKEYLTTRDLSETVIFHSADSKQELYESMELNEREREEFDANSKIKIFSTKQEAEAIFQELSGQNQTVHFLEFEEKQFVWCDSYGSVENLRKYIDQEQSKISLVEEDNLIRKIKNRKVVILANDPGMGKSTTLVKLYETDSESSSIKNSHWVIVIKLKKYLQAIRNIDLEKDHITIVTVVEFLSKIDSKLNNKLAKSLLAVALNKNVKFSKSLLLAFDGFDEVLDEDDRKRILLLLKFIKNETAAKLWITTRLHLKASLEKELITFACKFASMDSSQKSEYIAKYLQSRLCLILNEKMYTEFFNSKNEKKDNKSIQIFTKGFFKKMDSIFSCDTGRFMRTPLQFDLMLENSVSHVKFWIENEEARNLDFNYVGNDLVEVYENFIERKFDVYFHKVGIREGIQKAQEKNYLNQCHKDFAKFRILELKPKKYFDEMLDKILLAGIIKSEFSDLQFIHKTFEEFFAAKVFVHWIKKGTNKFPNINKQKHLLKYIFKKSDYQLIRTFINIQLQKEPEHGIQNELNENLRYSRENAANLLNEYESLSNDDNGTALHIAITEHNKAILCFLLQCLKEQPDVLRKFIFIPDKYGCTALHLACKGNDVHVVKELLDVAEDMDDAEDDSKNTLKKLLKCLNNEEENALDVAVRYSNNVQILKELLSRAINKLDLILTSESALCKACVHKKEEFVDFFLREFEHEADSLKQLLLHDDGSGNVLCHAWNITIAEKLISAAQLLKDNNETLKKFILSDKGEYLPLRTSTEYGSSRLVHSALNIANDFSDNMKQLLFNKRCRISALHTAARWGRGDVIKLLLKTAADLGVEVIEKLIIAVDKEGKNAMELMFEGGHETIFDESFKILEEDKYENIREIAKKMFYNVPPKSRRNLETYKFKLNEAIEMNDINKVKDILNRANDYRFFTRDCLIFLISSGDYMGRYALYNACLPKHPKIIKELFTFVMNLDDGGATLKKILTKPAKHKVDTVFDILAGSYTEEMDYIISSLLSKARENKKMHAVDILERISKEYGKAKFYLELRKFLQRLFERRRRHSSLYNTLSNPFRSRRLEHRFT